MTKIEQLLAKIAQDDRCEVLEPRGLPEIRSNETLSQDIEEFYRLCGGVTLFKSSQYLVSIVSPKGLVRSNPEIIGQEAPDDITDTWYIVARGGSEEAVSIDCGTVTPGRCYDSFWDRHGVAGSCSVIALSFTELLDRLYANGGKYWYWLADEWIGYGDAYDAT